MERAKAPAHGGVKPPFSQEGVRMNTPERVVEYMRDGRLGIETAAGLFTSLIDQENVDRVMPLWPKSLMEFVQIEAGMADDPKVIYIPAAARPDPLGIAALRDWLERNGYPILRGKPGS